MRLRRSFKFKVGKNGPPYFILKELRDIFPCKLFLKILLSDCFQYTPGKLTTKKKTRIVSVNNSLVSLQLAWNMFLKSVMQSVFIKATGFY